MTVASTKSNLVETSNNSRPFVVVWDLDSIPFPQDYQPWELFQFVGLQAPSLVKWYFVSSKVNDKMRSSWLDFQLQVQFLQGDLMEVSAILVKHLAYIPDLSAFLFCGVPHFHTVLQGLRGSVSWVYPESMICLPWFFTKFKMTSMEQFMVALERTTSELNLALNNPSLETENNLVKEDAYFKPPKAPVDRSASVPQVAQGTNVAAIQFERPGSAIPKPLIRNEHEETLRPIPKDIFQHPVSNAVRITDPNQTQTKDISVLDKMVPENHDFRFFYDRFKEVYEANGVRVIRHSTLQTLGRQYRQEFESLDLNINEYICVALKRGVIRIAHTKAKKNENIFELSDESVFDFDPLNVKYQVLYEIYRDYGLEQFRYNDLLEAVQDFDLTKGAATARQLVLDSQKDGVTDILSASESLNVSDPVVLVDVWYLNVDNQPSQPSQLREINIPPRNHTDSALELREIPSLKAKSAPEKPVNQVKQASFVPPRQNTAKNADRNSFYTEVYKLVYDMYLRERTDTLPLFNLIKMGMVCKKGFTSVLGFVNHLVMKGLVTGQIITPQNSSYFTITDKLIDMFENVNQEAPEIKQKVPAFNQPKSFESEKPKKDFDYKDFVEVLKQNEEMIQLVKLLQSAFNARGLKKVPKTVINSIYDKHIKSNFGNADFNIYIKKAVSLNLVKDLGDAIAANNIQMVVKCNLSILKESKLEEAKKPEVESKPETRDEKVENYCEEERKPNGRSFSSEVKYENEVKSEAYKVDARKTEEYEENYEVYKANVQYQEVYKNDANEYYEKTYENEYEKSYGNGYENQYDQNKSYDQNEKSDLTQQFEPKNVENYYIEKDYNEKNNVEKNNVEKNNFEKNNFEKNNFEKNSFEKNSFEKNNVEKDGEEDYNNHHFENHERQDEPEVLTTIDVEEMDEIFLQGSKTNEFNEDSDEFNTLLAMFYQHNMNSGDTYASFEVLYVLSMDYGMEDSLENLLYDAINAGYLEKFVSNDIEYYNLRDPSYLNRFNED
jgi:hypothetical protein